MASIGSGGGAGDEIVQDVNFVAEQYATQQQASLGPAPLPGSIAITSLNGLSGPTITFSGGTTGLSFVPGGTTIALSGTLVIANGGTGATTVAGILTNIGIAKQNATNGAPTVNDDSGDGYSPCSLWVDTGGSKAYICIDATLGAAVWQLLS